MTSDLGSGVLPQEQERMTARVVTGKRQQLFQLRSIKLELKKRETRTHLRQSQRKINQLAEKTQPRRLGRLK